MQLCVYTCANDHMYIYIHLWHHKRQRLYAHINHQFKPQLICNVHIGFIHVNMLGSYIACIYIFYVVVVKYQPPPPVKSRIALSHTLINEIVHKLCVDSYTYGATLILTGAVEFDTIVRTLCHIPLVTETFTDGFVFTEFGPGDIDPINKLSEMYNSLTGERCDNSVVEEKIQILTSDHCCNLLIVIFDVWKVKHTEPILKAFSNCKIIITTMSTEIKRYLPSQYSVTVDSGDVQGDFSLLV